MAKPSVRPVPAGYHTITPLLICPEVARAIDFYKAPLGAEERLRMPGPDGKIMHAELKIGDSIVMLGGECPEGTFGSPRKIGGTPVGLYMYVENVDAAYKRAVEAGAAVVEPLADMFWGDRCGTITDPFGHRWSLAQHVEDLSPKEIEVRQRKFMEQQEPRREAPRPSEAPRRAPQ